MIIIYNAVYTNRFRIRNVFYRDAIMMLSAATDPEGVKHKGKSTK